MVTFLGHVGILSYHRDEQPLPAIDGQSQRWQLSRVGKASAYGNVLPGIAGQDHGVLLPLPFV